MKKKLLSLLLLACVALGSFVGCDQLGGLGGGNGSGSASVSDSSVEESIEFVDYVPQVHLNLDSAETKKLEVNLNAYTHIDGDTTHFRSLNGENIPDKVLVDRVLKARYMAVNTPESTGEIQEWGKAASKFTESKLANASSVVLESDDENWNTDANGRYLVWVWYKPKGSDTYRNLNLELLQEGLALAANATGTRYGESCLNATLQAQKLKLYVFSDEKDPDYFYGTALNADLKTIRTNLEYYSGKRVAITATVSYYYSKGSIYVEEYDDDSGLYYGMPIFYGMHNLSWSKILKPGNQVFLVGEVSYSKNYGYQICNLKLDEMDPDNPENIRVVGEAGQFSASYKETTLTDFYDKITVSTAVYDEENDCLKTDEDDNLITEPKSYDYKALALSTSVTIKGLTVVDAYTTKQGESKGAMTLTCKDENGKEIDVRTEVWKKADNTLYVESDFMGKTIDVMGFVDYYDGDYQIKVFTPTQVTVK